jgi:hypothetical protein
MMKSMALTESAVDSHSTSAGVTEECDAEDFILVSSSPNAESANWEVSFDDDASYDRCDDVCSLYSAPPQSLAIESNALDSFQKDFFSRGGRADAINKATTATEDFLLHDFSAMGLSSGGIIDLPDDDLRDLIATFSVDDDDGDDIDGQLPPPFETSDSSVSGASNVQESDDEDGGDAIAKLHPDAWGKAPVVNSTGSEPDRDNNPASSDDDDDIESILDEAMSKKVLIKPTRLCKKKRRKQLKLTKKAAAAAAAAAALSHFGSMVGTAPPSSTSARGGATSKGPNGGKLNKRNASRSRKQIANIAVACATESYASYREECLRKSKK